MSWKEKIKTSFEKNSAELFKTVQPHEEVSVSLESEQSDFVRFNASKVRQATSVEQAQVTLTIQARGKLNKISFPMTGDLSEDRKRFLLYCGKARQELAHLPENPFPILFPETGKSEFDETASTPTSSFMIDKVAQDAAQDDFVGYLSSGPILRAMANSKGTYHWYSSDIYFVDYSLFDGQRAVTGTVAGSNWSEKGWQNSLNESRAFLHQMKKPAQEIPRGDYQVYLAPAAVSDLLSTASWGGLSYRDYKLGVNGLRLLFDREQKLSPQFTLLENFDLGIHPRFNSMGEISPARLNLIENGESRNLLANSKTAAEYKIESNGADELEVPRSLELRPGKISRDNIFKEIGTGLYLSNLHYINWSDQKSARMTGMTRYACFWVENGDIVSPIKDVRFDVSLYDIFGSNLVGLTDFQETQMNILTYGSRGLGGKKVPGILVKDFKFTL